MLDCIIDNPTKDNISNLPNEIKQKVRERLEKEGDKNRINDLNSYPRDLCGMSK